ncbi:3-oxoacyl-[acyl-carrier protein] reductase [Stackebrandtia albiflava]|uniref:3-oxoacyl-[acyl-carrier protein] reductase n=1 Tax=Stackebrandtia albiflava TaxID=406432 RepID=A0A562UQL4_9ACTN|nr:SDR family oxidoreductase [Stackebrandtia albiflava]TWJ07913.1 3-oxoacyl-[acyl-carrier protein] reductase [Stackebrandtia albiflava]
MTRNILVTGGGTGLGAAMAARFTAGGDRVFLTGRRPEPLAATAAALGETATAIACDHSDTRSLRRLADALPERIDVLINNAGGNTAIGAPPPEDIEGVEMAWRANLSANLMSAVLTTSLLMPRVPDGGSMIHIGSIAADKGTGAYGAAKAALASWNLELAREVGPRGVTSNVLSPGYIVDTEFFKGLITEESHAMRVSATMIKRAGNPSDIAGTAYFLASSDARNITGQVLKVDGGAFPSR